MNTLMQEVKSGPGYPVDSPLDIINIFHYGFLTMDHDNLVPLMLQKADLMTGLGADNRAVKLLEGFRSRFSSDDRSFWQINQSLAEHYIRMYRYSEAERVLGEASWPEEFKAEEFFLKSELKKSRHLYAPPDFSGSALRLVKIASELWPHFTGIRRAVLLLWHEGPGTMKKIRQLENQYQVPPVSRIPEQGWTAMGQFFNEELHLILICSHPWKQADDFSLKGLLAHEMAHEEWKEQGALKLMPSPASSHLVISKGLGRELLASRRFKEMHLGDTSFSGILAPRDIEHLLDSGFSKVHEAQWMGRFARMFQEQTGNNAVSLETWREALGLWENVLKIYPGYSLGLQETAFIKDQMSLYQNTPEDRASGKGGS